MTDLKPVNQNLESVTYEDILNHKTISVSERQRDLDNLRRFDASENRNAFYGNSFLYHYQFENLVNCARERGSTLKEIWDDPEQRAKLLDSTRKRNRGGRTAAGNIYECYRANTGSVVMFKATTAKYVYTKYRAQRVLDPTAGWGGRMLGAWALDIDYVGMDTNTDLQPAYDKMIQFLRDQNRLPGLLFEAPQSDLQMLWGNCLDQDFASVDYDLVLTSPPYVNLELYPHMTPWKSNEEFYQEFFLPLWSKCRKHIRKGGTICFNISPRMYDHALAQGLPLCDDSEDLLQQLGQQKTRKRQDKIYVWHC